jgi:hypothetical protein
MVSTLHPASSRQSRRERDSSPRDAKSVGWTRADTRRFESTRSPSGSPDQGWFPAPAKRDTGRATRKKLNSKGEEKVTAKVTYTPDGGEANTRRKGIKLVKR